MLLITGADGQLGQCLKEIVPDALYTDVTQLDITDTDAVYRFVRENHVDVVINCAGYTAVDKAEDEPELCYRINVDGVANLARTGAKIIHISTDYVFDGTKCVPYVETDKTAPRSVYGASKAAGEEALMRFAETAVVVRTGWLYSAFGNNFVKTMLRLGEQRDTLSVVFDQTGTPTYAPDLAAVLVKMASETAVGTKEMYHFSNEGVASWYDLAVASLHRLRPSCRVLPIESAAYPTKAVRPSYSVLNKTKIKNAFGMDIPYWKESLELCLKKF